MFDQVAQAWVLQKSKQTRNETAEELPGQMIPGITYFCWYKVKPLCHYCGNGMEVSFVSSKVRNTEDLVLIPTQQISGIPILLVLRTSCSIPILPPCTRDMSDRPMRWSIKVLHEIHLIRWMFTSLEHQSSAGLTQLVSDPNYRIFP